jgi:drug/metabolite transporter (DMT)-like permease
MSTSEYVKRPLVGHIALLSSVTLFAANGSVSKSLLVSGIDAAQLSQIRVTGAFAILIVLALIFVRKELKLKLNEIPKFVSYGIVGVALVQYLYFVAINRLDIGVALVIEYTAPLLVALWARFGEKEKVRQRVWYALAITIFGLSLVTNLWGGFTLDGIGFLAAALAAISLAIYFIMGEKLVVSRSPLAVVTLAFGASTIFWAVLEPWWDFDPALLEGQVTLVADSNSTVSIWVLMTWMVVMGTIAPFFLSFVSLRHLKARTAAIVGTLEPVVASAIAFVLLNESLLVIQLLGGAAVLIGVIIAETAKENTNKN